MGTAFCCGILRTETLRMSKLWRTHCRTRHWLVGAGVLRLKHINRSHESARFAVSRLLRGLKHDEHTEDSAPDVEGQKRPKAV